MNESEIAKYLSRQGLEKKPAFKKLALKKQAEKKQKDTFDQFAATEIFCLKCKQAMPVKEKLLLYLPGGELYSYNCVKCRTSVGTRRA